MAFKDLVDINAISEHTVLKVVIDGNEVATTVREATFVPAGTKWGFDPRVCIHGHIYLRMGEALVRF